MSNLKTGGLIAIFCACAAFCGGAYMSAAGYLPSVVTYVRSGAVPASLAGTLNGVVVGHATSSLTIAVGEAKRTFTINAQTKVERLSAPTPAPLNVLKPGQTVVLNVSPSGDVLSISFQ